MTDTKFHTQPNTTMGQEYGPSLLQTTPEWDRDQIRPEDRPLLVKVDTIGLGWGPTGTLQAWATEGRHPLL